MRHLVFLLCLALSLSACAHFENVDTQGGIPLSLSFLFPRRFLSPEGSMPMVMGRLRRRMRSGFLSSTMLWSTPRRQVPFIMLVFRNPERSGKLSALGSLRR